MSNVKVRLAKQKYIENTIVDGPDVRLYIAFQGCRHNCPGCFNPSCHSFTSGVLVDIKEVKEKIANSRYIAGITFSGGDSIEQPEAVKELSIYAHSLGLNIWLYSGYTFEQLLKDKQKMEALKEVDVLVDGPYIQQQRDLSLAFRGSRNQRIIDIQQSIKRGKLVEHNYDKIAI